MDEASLPDGVISFLHFFLLNYWITQQSHFNPRLTQTLADGSFALSQNNPSLSQSAPRTSEVSKLPLFHGDIF